METFMLMALYLCSCLNNPDSCGQSELVLIECFSHTGRSSACVWQKYILHTDECHLFICLFHLFAVILVGLYKSMQDTVCTEHKVTYSSDVFMHMNPTKDDVQISHISINHSRNQHKKRETCFIFFIFYYYYLLVLLCASAVIYLADICQKHCAISVLEKKMCNVNS